MLFSLVCCSVLKKWERSIIFHCLSQWRSKKLPLNTVVVNGLFFLSHGNGPYNYRPATSYIKPPLYQGDGPQSVLKFMNFDAPGGICPK